MSDKAKKQENVTELRVKCQQLSDRLLNTMIDIAEELEKKGKDNGAYEYYKLLCMADDLEDQQDDLIQQKEDLAERMAILKKDMDDIRRRIEIMEAKQKARLAAVPE